MNNQALKKWPIGEQFADIFHTYEIVSDHEYDPWGAAMGLLFEVAHNLHHEPEHCVPPSWQYSPSVSGTLGDDDQTYFSELFQLDGDDLIVLGEFLRAHCDDLRADERDY